MTDKFIQISTGAFGDPTNDEYASGHVIYALTEQGEIWYAAIAWREPPVWRQLPNLPRHPQEAVS